jgi:hypothetical protein
MKTSIVSIKRVKNDRLQAEIVDHVERRVSTLSLLNKGDKAFDPKSIRHAWFPVTVESLIDLGASASLVEKVEASKLGEDKIECLIENPMLRGQRLRIQVTETVNPNAYQAENKLKMAKQLEITKEVIENKNLAKHADIAMYAGETGYFLTEEGQFIFSNSTVEVEAQLKHSFIEAYLVPESLLSGVGAELAAPIKQKENVNVF